MQRACCAGTFKTVVLDFDGTLARIRKEPSKVRLPACSRRVLAKLVHEGVKVVVLSGRQSSFLKKQGFPKGVVLQGNFGNKTNVRWSPGEGFLDALAALRRIDGVIVEKKAGWAVHYRNVGKKDIGKVQGLILDARKTAGKHVLAQARKAVEFLPQKSSTKADFLAQLAEKSKGNVLFIGDDWQDLHAIGALSGRKNFCGMLVKSREVKIGKFKPKMLEGRKGVLLLLGKIAKST